MDCVDESPVDNSRDNCGGIRDEMNLFQVFKLCTLALLFFSLSGLFVGLVAKWCKRRRDVYRLLQNLPEFPLPPFQGPGEHAQHEHHNLGYSDSDFRSGGDVFEGFARMRRRMEEDNKNGGSDVVSTRSNTGCTNFNWPCPDGDLEILEALVSLSLPHKMCIGLDRRIMEIMEKDVCGKVFRSKNKHRRNCYER